MLKHVYIPTFLNKLAAYGIVPRTEDDIKSLVKMAAMLSQLDQANTLARSVVGDETSRFIKESTDELSKNMYGCSDSKQQENMMKLAAAQQWMANDPTTRAAALIYAALANS
ncbi:MAG: hypothetical protein QXQ02_01735 [Halobacteria archaeon]